MTNFLPLTICLLLSFFSLPYSSAIFLTNLTRHNKCISTHSNKVAKKQYSLQVSHSVRRSSCTGHLFVHREFFLESLLYTAVSCAKEGNCMPLISHLCVWCLLLARRATVVGPASAACNGFFVLLHGRFLCSTRLAQPILHITPKTHLTLFFSVSAAPFF